MSMDKGAPKIKPRIRYMQTDTDHLPLRKQKQLERIVKILLDEFERAKRNFTVPHKRNARVLKIILYGSHARGGWVEDRESGYRSDFDIMVVVNNKAATEVVDFWETAEDRLEREISTGLMKPDVMPIYHSMTDINQRLSNGQYFFSDIVEEGILLYNAKGSGTFIAPQLPTHKKSLEVAQQHYDSEFSMIRMFLQNAENNIKKKTETKNPHEQKTYMRGAAFFLHQAIEYSYGTALLTLTNYFPPTHNIKHLRSLCEGMETDLMKAWPRYHRRDRRCFSLMKEAYVKARYSPHYAITDEELQWCMERIKELRLLVRKVCKKRLALLKKRAQGG